MFRTMKMCIVFISFMTETWSFLTFQAGGMIGQGQTRQAQAPVDSRMVRNVLTTGQMLVQLGKQELRELSDLAGVQLGGDLLFNGIRSDTTPSFGFSLGSSVNSNFPSSLIATESQKYPSSPETLSAYPSSTSFPQTAAQGAPATSVNTGAGSYSQLVYQPDPQSVPLSLENAETPQTSEIPVPTPPYKGSFNPLAEDNFHIAFSILNPTPGNKKSTDPIMYPVQFYSPEALQKTSLQENTQKIPSGFKSNYDNFDAW